MHRINRRHIHMWFDQIESCRSAKHFPCSFECQTKFVHTRMRISPNVRSPYIVDVFDIVFSVSGWSRSQTTRKTQIETNVADASMRYTQVFRLCRRKICTWGERCVVVCVCAIRIRNIVNNVFSDYTPNGYGFLCRFCNILLFSPGVTHTNSFAHSNEGHSGTYRVCSTERTETYNYSSVAGVDRCWLLI